MFMRNDTLVNGIIITPSYGNTQFAGGSSIVILSYKVVPHSQLFITVWILMNPSGNQA